MDSIDRQILLQLQTNARVTNAELADKVNLSPTPCLHRVRKLEEDGVIKAYRAELDLDKIGLGISALVFIQLTLNSTANGAQFEQAISQIQRVQECFVLTGRYDYLLRVVAQDLSDYEQLVKGELANIPNIKTIESTIVLNQLNANATLPLIKK
jgi:Lrp/AsnC family leucine-responsive transcriptional regulator